MKQKALGNLNVAQLLLNRNAKDTCDANASVHCSYYAVFQYMKYLLATTDRRPLSYDTQSKKTSSKSSHDYIIQEIQNRLECKVEEERKLVQKVRNLKNMRRVADYDSTILSQREGLDSKHEAETIIASLKRYFGDI